jgi:hypothetical protein
MYDNMISLKKEFQVEIKLYKGGIAVVLGEPIDVGSSVQKP